MGSSQHDQLSNAWSVDMSHRVTSPGSRLLLAFPRYLVDLVVAGIGELNDLALVPGRWSAEVALPLGTPVVVIAS